MNENNQIIKENQNIDSFDSLINSVTGENSDRRSPNSDTRNHKVEPRPK